MLEHMSIMLQKALYSNNQFDRLTYLFRRSNI